MKIKKHFGQHFLTCQQTIKDIISASGDITGKNILEVGPGKGELTTEILQQNPTKLIAIEIDRDCLPYHEKLLSQYENYALINDNALKIKEENISETPIKVISNLPYNISIELLCKWLDNINIFESLTLMFQKEVAERIVASHGNKKYGKISVMVQLLCTTEYLFTVPNHLFSPPPKVDSAVIKITPRAEPLFAVEMKSLKNMLRVLFCYRRKMVHTILKNMFHNVPETLKQLNIDMKARPEDLSIQQFCQLTTHLK